MSVLFAFQAKRAPIPIRMMVKTGLKVPKTCSPKIMAAITKNMQKVANRFLFTR